MRAILLDPDIPTESIGLDEALKIGQRLEDALERINGRLKRKQRR